MGVNSVRLLSSKFLGRFATSGKKVTRKYFELFLGGEITFLKFCFYSIALGKGGALGHEERYIKSVFL